jgi:short-subunit dehydrogenase
MQISKRTALITGVSSGIGAAYADRLQSVIELNVLPPSRLAVAVRKFLRFFAVPQ